MSKIEAQKPLLSDASGHRSSQHLHTHDSWSEQERKEKALWAKYVDEEHPNVFKFLELAQDGGFSEVKGLYDVTRWISGAILIIFVVYNIYAVIELDVSFIKNPKSAVETLRGGQPVGDHDPILDSFYSTTGVLKNFGLKGGGAFSVQVLGGLELVGLAVWLLWTIKYTIDAVCDDGFKRWHGIQAIFWEILPALSTYSAIKLLNYIVPTVLIQKITEYIYAITEAKSEGRSVMFEVFKLLQYLLTAVFAFFVGFDTFLLKLRVVATKATDPEGSSDPHTILACVQFLVQILGIVQLGPFVRDRLFQFVFGGEDGIMQDEETELKETWNALLAKRMYRDLTFPQFIAVMTSFSDIDFQGLVLNENAEAKAELSADMAAP